MLFGEPTMNTISSSAEKRQESNVLGNNTQLDFTQELHRIRAHLLHYAGLLADFQKTVEFIQKTHYPALENEKYFTLEEKKESIDLMDKECKNLLNEIARLDMARKMQDKRLANVVQLVSLFPASTYRC